MKEKQRKPVNSKLPEEVIKRWHLFAVQNQLNKERALEELIKRGSKK